MRIPKLHISGRSDGNVLITIDPPHREQRGNVDIVCVIDVSGSMQVEATMKDEKGDVETHGLSILDVVKHSVKTIIKTMKKEDRLSIVTFSTEAKVIFNLISMNEKGKKRALRELRKLDVETQTNLWDGLFQGMEVMRKAKAMPNQGHVILFTDGLPNVVPPRGHLKMLEQYQTQHHISSINRPSLHFFGFGYSLDSELLEDLARLGRGMFSYIPDSSFVGTIFVNAIANIFSSLSSHAVLSLEPVNGTSVIKVIGEFSVIDDENEDNEDVVTVLPGTIRYGNQKDLIIQMNLPEDFSPELPMLRCKLSYPTPNRLDNQLTEIIVEGGQLNLDEKPKEIEIHTLRLMTVESLRRALHFARNKSDLKGAQFVIDEMLKMIDSSADMKKNKFIQDLCKDLNGQVTLSISRQEWFDRWAVKNSIFSCMLFAFVILNNEFPVKDLENQENEIGICTINLTKNCPSIYREVLDRLSFLPSSFFENLHILNRMFIQEDRINISYLSMQISNRSILSILGGNKRLYFNTFLINMRKQQQTVQHFKINYKKKEVILYDHQNTPQPWSVPINDIFETNYCGGMRVYLVIRCVTSIFFDVE